MSRRTFLPYAAGLALAVTLTGCAAESAAPEPTTPVPTPAAPSSSVATSVTAAPAASPTSAAPDFPEGLPAAAKKHTKDGAVAFVKYFIDQVNQAWTSPDASRLEGMCLTTSKACAAFVDDARELEAKNRRYDGEPVTVVSTEPMGTIEGSQRVLVQLIQEKRNVVDSTGRRVKTDPREELRLLALVRWGQSGWQLASIGPLN